MCEFRCADCGELKPMQTSGGTGYAVRDNGERVCYECCAEADKRYMDGHDHMDLYLAGDEATVQNWPGTLHFPVDCKRRGHHNIARTRTDVWFRDHRGRSWWGVQYGKWSRIVRCRRLKEAA